MYSTSHFSLCYCHHWIHHLSRKCLFRFYTSVRELYYPRWNYASYCKLLSLFYKTFLHPVSFSNSVLDLLFSDCLWTYHIFFFSRTSVENLVCVWCSIHVANVDKLIVSDNTFLSNKIFFFPLDSTHSQPPPATNQAELTPVPQTPSDSNQADITVHPQTLAERNPPVPINEAIPIAERSMLQKFCDLIYQKHQDFTFSTISISMYTVNLIIIWHLTCTFSFLYTTRTMSPISFLTKTFEQILSIGQLVSFLFE